MQTFILLPLKKKIIYVFYDQYRVIMVNNK